MMYMDEISIIKERLDRLERETDMLKQVWIDLAAFLKTQQKERS